MSAPTLLFGDFTQDEIALLFTEKQKGFEFVYPAAGRYKAKATRVNVKKTSVVTSGNFCTPELAPAVVVKAGDLSPLRETGDQSKNASRLNANAPAFVPGRAEYDKDSHPFIQRSPPEEQSGTSKPIEHGASVINNAVELPSSVLSQSNVMSAVVCPKSSWSGDTTTAQPQNATDLEVSPTDANGPTFQPSVSVPSALTSADHATEPDTTSPPNSGPSTGNSGYTRTLQPATQKSWASVVRSPVVTGCGSGFVQAPPSAQPGCVTAAAQVPRSNGHAVPKDGGPVTSVCANTAVVKDLQDPKMHSTSAQAQLHSLGEQLQKTTISYEPPAIIPRGLTNVGNWCYVHAPLQALLALPGLHQLLRTLNPFPALLKGVSATPITDSLIQFFHEFAPLLKNLDSLESDVHKGKRTTTRGGDLVRGDSFKPDCIYQMLQEIKSNFSFKGRQEDAEEFLGCLLDGLHEEMVAARQAVAAAVGNEPGSKEEVTQDTGGDELEWEHVGPKNRSSVLRKALLKDSPIRDIFGGQMYCSVHRHGTKESVTVEPFFSLQLDLQSEDVRTVQQALDSLVTREVVQMNTGSEAEVEAHRRTTLASLPCVLVLHLKRFLYNANGGGLQKLMKPVEYSVDLEISKDFLAPTIRPKVSATQRSYRLWAVVYHHGNTATGGHYTCDAYHPLSGGWMHMDDSNLKLVSEDQVLFKSQMGNRLAYLLFYVRTDLLKTKK